jgi:hypothetical protein
MDLSDKIWKGSTQRPSQPNLVLTIFTTPFETIFLVQVMFGKPCCQYEFKFTAIILNHYPLKMADITININFFNCLLLLYYKSKWAQIWTAVTQHWVVQHIFFFLKIYTDKSYFRESRGSVGWACVAHLSFCFEET